MSDSLDILCHFINGGAWKESEYVDAGIPVVKVSNLKRDQIQLDQTDYLSIEGAKKYVKNLLKKDDLVIATVGSHPSLESSAAGRATIIPQSIQGYLLNQNAVCVRSKNTNKLDQQYLGYLAKTKTFEGFIQNRGKGAANQMRIPIGAIKSFVPNLPKITTQRKIASILSAYDDLIENNLKRIKLLEELAQITYEEWFVTRRIQGNQINDSYIDTVRMEELVSDYMNGGWGKEEVVGNYTEEAYVIRGTDMPDISYGNFSGLPLRFHTKSNLKPRRLKPGDISIEMSNGNIGNVGRSFLFDGSLDAALSKPIMCASFCKMLRPKSLELGYIIDLHLKYIHRTDKMLVYKSQGANGINNFRFEDMIADEELFIPKNEYYDQFVEPVKNIYNLISNLRIQISLLKEARDILLPRLMTGMIDVEKITIEKPETV